MTATNDTATMLELPSKLADLVGDVDAFLADAWETRPRSFACPAALRLLTQSDVWDMLDCGLLVAPYFSIATEGASTLSGITETRSVQNRPMPLYAKAETIRASVAGGRILKLNQADHWHAGLQELIGNLRTELRADVRSSVVLSPKDAQIGPQTDGANLLILQLEGQTHWRVAPSVDCGAGEDQWTEVALRPGEVLYLPADRRYSAITGDRGALHVAITALQPTARDLAELALARFLGDPRAEEIAGSHHLMPLEEKVAWLRTQLVTYLVDQDLGALVDEAVTIRCRSGHA
jgi:hypothetical protein